MARTPAISRFRTFCRAARASRRTGVPTEEILGAWRQQAAQRVSRRALLRGLGAMVPLAPLIGCGGADSAAANKDGARVVIVGAGLAGLNACHRLAQAGVYADVVEGRDRVGGRVLTGRGLFTGGEALWTELGGEWVNSNDKELLALCTELGLGLLDTETDDDLSAIAWIDGTRYTEGQIYGRATGLLTAVDDALATLGDETVSYASPGGATTLDNLSVAEFLAGLDVDPVAIAFADSYCTTEYGLDTSEQSTLNLLYLLGGSGGGYDERYKIDGGNDQVVTGLAALYEDRIQLGKTLVALRETGGVTTLTFADGAEMEADFVILALPFTLLRQVDITVTLPAVKRAVIDTLGYGTNAKVILPFSRPAWRDSGDAGDVTSDAPFQGGWQSSALQAGDFTVYANFVGGSHGVAVGEGTEAAQGEALLDDLAAIWPAARDAVAGEGQVVHWPTDPFVLGSYACYKVGQWTTIGGAEAEPVGNIFFAGEHTSTEFQGYLNGAAQSGKDAAADVLAAMEGTARRARRISACRRFGLT